MSKSEKIAVVVTTAHRGVFFGHIQASELDSKTVHLAEAQMCVYWSADLHGVYSSR